MLPFPCLKTKPNKNLSRSHVLCLGFIFFLPFIVKHDRLIYNNYLQFLIPLFILKLLHQAPAAHATGVALIISDLHGAKSTVLSPHWLTHQPHLIQIITVPLKYFSSLGLVFLSLWPLLSLSRWFLLFPMSEHWNAPRVQSLGILSFLPTPTFLLL